MRRGAGLVSPCSLGGGRPFGVERTRPLALAAKPGVSARAGGKRAVSYSPSTLVEPRIERLGYAIDHLDIIGVVSRLAL